MVTRRQVLELVEAGVSYDDAAARLGVSPGLAYLVATGLPADGSETTLTDAERARRGILATSTQHLANPAPVQNPTHHDLVHEWIGSRVRADAAMQRAAAQQSLSAAPKLAFESDRDITAELARDHNAVHALTKQFKTTPGVTKGGEPDQVDKRVALVAHITARLASHDHVEAEHLWPLVERVVPDGASVAADARAQEQQLTATLEELAVADPHDARYDELVEQMETQIRQHVAFEERVFLTLRDVTSDDERQQLGARVRAAEIVEHAKGRTDGTA